MNGLATLCFLNYAKSGIDFLDLRYVSYFYNTVPATTYTVIAMNLADGPRGTRDNLLFALH